MAFSYSLKKVTKQRLYSRGCNDLLESSHLILHVMTPSQQGVTVFLHAKKPLLVTIKK
jgi:hypothetical protein